MYVKKTNKDYLMPILMIILIGLLGWMIFSSNQPTPEPKPYIITIPGGEGSTGTQILRETQPVPIYIPGKGEIIVDDTWRKLYQEAKDSLEKQRVFDQAIVINKYDTTFIDNDTLKVSGQLETRGELTKYKFDWELKDRYLTVDPIVIKENPTLSLTLESGVAIPTTPTGKFVIEGGIGVENKKGRAIILKYNSAEMVGVSFRQRLNLIK